MLFSGVEKYISYKEFNRQKGAQRNLKGRLGGEAVGGRRTGAGGGGRGGNTVFQAKPRQIKRRKGREVGAQREPGAASRLLPCSF